MHLGDLIARVRVSAVTGQLTPELAREVLDELGRRALPAEREGMRNDLVCKAFSILDGAPYHRARTLESEIKALAAVRCPLPDGRGQVRDLLIEALRIDPEMPRGWRQLLRIVESLS